MMPSLDEVLDAFPDKRLLINIKSDDPAEGTLLSERLRLLSTERQSLIMVYGGNAPIEIIRRRLPGMLTLSRGSLMACLTRCLALGWTGHVPDACRTSLLLVPANYVGWLWGWPEQFLRRMDSVAAQVFVVGRSPGGDFSSGIDSAEDLRRLPEGSRIGYWTNRIDRIAPLVRRP